MGGTLLITAKNIIETAEKMLINAREGNVTFNSAKGINYSSGESLEYGKYEEIPFEKNDYSVAEIEILNLDEGSDNGGENDKFGMIHGKTYKLKVSKFAKEKAPKDESSIKWGYSYSTEKGPVIAAFKNKTGKEISFTTNDLEMCGRLITFYAYINDKTKEASLDVFHHNRFRWFDRNKLDNGLKDRMNDETMINQHKTSLCGTVLILYYLIQINKDSYYKEFSKFFRTGQAKINNFKLEPNEKIFDMNPNIDEDFPAYRKRKDGTIIIPPRLMGFSDWITLVGTRSSDNKSYTGKDGEEWDAINWVDYMVEAFKKVLNFSMVVDKTRIITGLNFINELKEMEKDFQSGYKVAMLIDSDMLDDSDSYLGCLTQYHWVSYEGDLVIDEKNKTVQFSYFCWAVKYKKITFRKSVFNTNYYGYIKGK